jgi:hypothetical protein
VAIIKDFKVKNISFSKESLNHFLLDLEKDTSCIKFLPNMSIHTFVFSILILFWAKVRYQKRRCGYLDIQLATNVAIEEILLDIAGLVGMGSEPVSQLTVCEFKSRLIQFTR